MSWPDLIKNPFIIRTGDGIEYRVLWKNPTYAMEFNVSEFEFPETDGTLAKRGRVKGGRYDLEFYFQGENNIEDSTAFKESAKDKRPWLLTHPFYGVIRVVPLIMKFDDTSLNVTKVTGTVVETITDDRPKMSINPVDKITHDKFALDQTFSVAFVANVQPNTSDIGVMKAGNKTAYDLGKKQVKLTLDAEQYFNAFNSANAAIIDATNEPLDAIQATQNVLNAPALFADTVNARINLLTDQFLALRQNIHTVTESSFKRIYENNIGAILSSMLLTSATPQAGDYKSRNDVVLIMEKIIENHNLFIEDLDALQTPNGGEPNSYIPDPQSMIAFNELFNYTIANLMNIALDSKQERIIILEDDSNPITLAHRFYGIGVDDATLIQFIDQNNIGLNEMLSLRKGRSVIYYV